MIVNDDWHTWHFAGIYCIGHVQTGKVYVGQSQDVAVRIANHHCERASQHLKRAIAKYGWDTFKVVLLEQVDDLTKLNYCEQFWINVFMAYDRDHGYNASPTAGSNRGWKMPREVVERKAKAQIGKKKRPMSDDARARVRAGRLKALAEGLVVSEETRAKLSAVHRGKVLSEDHKARLREWNTGRVMSPEACEKMRQAKLGTKQSAETIKKRADKLRGRTIAPDVRARMSEGKRQEWARRKARMAEEDDGDETL